VCDVAETCDGSVKTCGTDVFASPATVCQAATGGCDADDTCNGTAASCVNADTDLCAPGTPCTTGTMCTSGTCAGCDPYGNNCTCQ
jgi:hypothetical protein